MIEAGWSAWRVTRQEGCSDLTSQLPHWPLSKHRQRLHYGALVSSQTITRRLAEGHLASRCPLRVLKRHIPTDTFVRGGITHDGIEQKRNGAIFSDEPRFNLSSDDNRVRVWRPRGESFNPFALPLHTVPTAGVIVWGVIA
ncbi:transposable element Tcb1 transposase [Trichonephila clavipes]|nr:transposable element Tcb1 transposase [Trichonephila clavipes]